MPKRRVGGTSFGCAGSTSGFGVPGREGPGELASGLASRRKLEVVLIRRLGGAGAKGAVNSVNITIVEGWRKISEKSQNTSCRRIEADFSLRLIKFPRVHKFCRVSSSLRDKGWSDEAEDQPSSLDGGLPSAAFGVQGRRGPVRRWIGTHCGRVNWSDGALRSPSCLSSLGRNKSEVDWRERTLACRVYFPLDTNHQPRWQFEVEEVEAKSRAVRATSSPLCP